MEIIVQICTFFLGSGDDFIVRIYSQDLSDNNLLSLIYVRLCLNLKRI